MPPQTYFRSIEAVRLPSLAIVQAVNLPAVPLPSTEQQTPAGSLMLFISFVSSDGMGQEAFRRNQTWAIPTQKFALSAPNSRKLNLFERSSKK